NQDGTGNRPFATWAVPTACRFRITPKVGDCIRCNHPVHEPDADRDRHRQWWLLRRLSKKGCKRISCAVPRRCEEETGSDRPLRSMFVFAFSLRSAAVFPAYEAARPSRRGDASSKDMKRRSGLENQNARYCDEQFSHAWHLAGVTAGLQLCRGADPRKVPALSHRE